jgi:hypothetical protein
LLGERLYFGELVTQNPLMSALEPSSGLLGKEYVKDTEAESGHHLHVRTEEGRLWRISLEAVDAWTLPPPTGRHRTVRDRSPACLALPEDCRSPARAARVPCWPQQRKPVMTTREAE